jgi:hypothetical protein
MTLARNGEAQRTTWETLINLRYARSACRGCSNAADGLTARNTLKRSSSTIFLGFKYGRGGRALAILRKAIFDIQATPGFIKMGSVSTSQIDNGVHYRRCLGNPLSISTHADTE